MLKIELMRVAGTLRLVCLSMLTCVPLLSACDVEKTINGNRQGDGSTGGQNTTDFANVISVSVADLSSEYEVCVGISSRDVSCDHYADWWEIVSAAGELIHRRILTHPHVTEQPFVRCATGINIDPGEIVWVRAHMNSTGYGGDVFRGTLQDGFQKAEPMSGFAFDIENELPQPNVCAF